jgi:hypothetical protein
LEKVKIILLNKRFVFKGLFYPVMRVHNFIKNWYSACFESNIVYDTVESVELTADGIKPCRADLDGCLIRLRQIVELGEEVVLEGTTRDKGDITFTYVDGAKESFSVTHNREIENESKDL